MWTGLVTGTLMFVSPVLFDRLGWRGVAGATPIFMLWAGMPFFAGVVLYTLLPSTAAATIGPAMLRLLVIVGAVIQVNILVCFICTVDLTNVRSTASRAQHQHSVLLVCQSCTIRKLLWFLQPMSDCPAPCHAVSPHQAAEYKCLIRLVDYTYQLC